MFFNLHLGNVLAGRIYVNIILFTEGCNGDPNAVAKACPMACPSTCERPNSLPCSKKCQTLGCECAYGYLRDKINGTCILPDKCPGNVIMKL